MNVQTCSSVDLWVLWNCRCVDLYISVSTFRCREWVSHREWHSQSFHVFARRIFVKRVRKYIGSHLVELTGDLDALSSTAGVGGDKLFGPLVTDGLQSPGIDVDLTKFAPNDGEGGEIHFNLSRTKAMLVPTQEAFSIAEQSLEAFGLRASERPGGLVARCAVAC